MRPCLAAAALVLWPVASTAQVLPVPDRDDPRLATVSAGDEGMVRLDVPVGREVTVLLPAGEPVSSVSIAAPGDWQAEANGNGDAVVVRALRPVPETVMAVSTSRHAWRFLLSAEPVPQAPLVVRMVGTGPVRDKGDHADSVAATETTWRLSGNRELWPATIRDDGAKTFIEWPADRPIPAVFAVDGLGREEMVNGYMRGATFVIDRVHERLLFRIDKASATARRRTGGHAR